MTAILLVKSVRPAQTPEWASQASARAHLGRSAVPTDLLTDNPSIAKAEDIRSSDPFAPCKVFRLYALGI